MDGDHETLDPRETRGPSNEPPGTMFRRGDLVADRFRIIRFIARGGMGEVYEAQDVELNEHVALKTMRPGIAQDERTVRRFIREVNLSRRVTHPNVCRIFDVFHHEFPADSRGHLRRLPLVAMELLPGETLAARLRRAGPIAESDAGPIVAQMAEALTAAHNVGVIHRDFKSSNVILLPGATGELRAVVTDFGLAHRRRDADATEADATATGEVFGTPTYMSPEQVEGRQLTPATDIYALGIVMYEMVTGTLPFVGDTPLTTAVKRLQERAPSPRTFVPDLSPVWERTILRCLERQPGDRFAAAVDVGRALAGEHVVDAVESTRPRWRAPAAFAAVAVLAVALGFFASLAFRTSPASPLAADRPVAARRAVAVLGFRNLSGRPDTAWLSTAFSEMLTTELAAGEQIRTIPGESVTRARVDLGLTEAESLGQATLARLRTTLGTDLVVTGSYLSTEGGRIRLDLRLQDAVAGDTIATMSETATEAELIELVSRTGTRLRERLGIAELSAAQAAGVRAALPANPEAARLYTEGIVKLRLFDALAARDLLEKAVAADPGNPVARAALAAAWSELGYDSKAVEHAKAAVSGSGSLSREHRLSVEAQFAESMRDWEKAVSTYKSLSSLFPDDVDYGLHLASALLSGGRGAESLATVTALRALPAPASLDPRIEIAESEAAGSLSDFTRQQAAAARAADQARQLNARLLLARARLLEGSALDGLGDLTKAMAAYTEAGRLYRDAGDRRGVARSLNSVAIVLRDQGDLARARSMYEQSLATYKEIGDERNFVVVTANLANILRQQGDLRGATARYQEALDGARRIDDRRTEAQVLHSSAITLRQQGNLDGARARYQQALSIRRDLGDRRGVASTLNNLGNVLYDLEDLAGARTLYEESLSISRELGDKNGIALALGNVAGVQADQGNLAAAATMYADALAIRREMGSKSGIASALNTIANLLEDQGQLQQARAAAEEALSLYRELAETRGLAAVQFRLGEIRAAQGDLAAARSHHQEALALREKLEEQGTAASSRVALAKLSLRSGDPRTAEALAREAATVFAAQKAGDDEALAVVIVAESQLQQGRAAAARDAIARATALTRRSENRLVRFALGIARARVDAASGRVAEARKALETVSAEAASLGFRGYDLDARYALADIEVTRGDRVAGLARLAALAKEAERLGYRGIAQRATKSGAS
jgi:eukaryotic-like serine/threonine-protein kinase